MISELIAYIYKILVFSIFIIVLGRLLPEGNSKKYVKLVTGFILTFIIISPILTFISKYNEVQDNIIDSISVLNIGEEKYSKNSLENVDNTAYIDEVFSENMKTDIQNRVKQCGYIADNIDVKYDVDKNTNNANIKSISFSINGKASNDSNDIIQIKKISISDKSSENKDINISNEEKEKIVNTLVLAYEINKENINIM